MSPQYKLSSDFLAKGLTMPSTILGVPHLSALLNFVLNFFLGFVVCLMTKSILPIALFLLSIVGMHILMMKLCLEDIRAIDIAIKKPINTGSVKSSYLNKYFPNEATSGKHSFINYKERTPKRFIPYDVLVDDYTIATHDGLLMQFVSLDGIAYRTMDDVDVDIEKELRNRLLTQITNPNIALQYYLVKRKIDVYPNGEYEIDFPNKFNSKYKNKLKSKKFFEHKYYFAIIHKGMKNSSKGALNKVLAFFDGSDSMVNDTQLDAIDNLNVLSQKICAIFKKQNAKHLSVYQKDESNYSEQLEFISKILNLDNRDIRVPHSPINTNINYNEYSFAEQKGVIEIKSNNGASKYAAILSLKEYPKSSRADLFDVLLNENCELTLTQTFEFIPSNQAQKIVNEQQKRMEKSDASIDLTDELTVIEEDLKAGEIEVGQHNLALCVIADSETELQAKVQSVDSNLNQKSSLIFTRETKGCELAFWSLLPGNMRCNVRTSPISSLNFAGFASPHNLPKGQLKDNHWGSALTMFETDSGTAYAFSYHVGQVSTSTLVGLSGTGKTSVLSATLALSTKYKGWRFVFDRDHGMSVMVRALGGSYSELKMGIKTGMAPFQIQKSKSSIAFNTLLLKRILRKDKALSASDEKLIETVVERAFALPKEKRIFRNLAPFFGTPIDGSLREKFDRWHSNGANAWVFDSEVDNFQIDSNIYGLDITEMLKEAYSEVKTPIFMYLFERIGELLDGSPTMILIPEGWQVLQDEMFSAQIDAWSRTNRKNNVTLVMDTQSISEFEQATNKDSQSDLKGGNSLIREAVTTLFFANPKAKRSEYDSFNISDKEFDIIKHELEARKTEHFFLLKQGDKSVIARMPLHGLDYELDIISPNKHKIALGNELAKTIKDHKVWLKAYKTEVHRLKHDFNDNFKKWLSEFIKEAA